MSASQTPASVPQTNNSISNNNSRKAASPPSDVPSRHGTLSPGDSARGDEAISMARTPGAPGQTPAQMINFGTMHNADATALSSSPAGPAHAVQTVPTKFGSVAADAKSTKEKVVGFGTTGKPDGSAQSGTPNRSLDFNKLFQTGGNSPAHATTPSKPANGAAPGAAAITPRPASNAMNRPSFDGQRTPSQTGQTPQQHGSRVPSNAHASYNAHQQPRSPHMASQTPSMQQALPHLNGAQQWQGQPQMYYPPMYPGYAYAGMPQQMPHMGQQQQQQQQQQWAPQSQQSGSYDGQPRSPRHLTAASQNGTPGTPSISSSNNTGLASPASSQRSITNSAMTSPSPGHHIGMGLPPSRQASFQSAAGAGGSAFVHSPSHSFSGVNSMNASARQFEPSQSTSTAQKRISSAIKIVNPNTNAAVEFKPQAKKESMPSTPTPAPATPSATAKPAPSPSVNVATPVALAPTPAAASPSTGSPAPAARKSAIASPAPVPVPVPAPAAAIPTTPSASNKLETPEDFMKRVRAAAEEAKRLKEQKLAADSDESTRKTKDEADAKAKDEAAAEELLNKKKAEEEATAAREKQEEQNRRDREQAERKAADEAAATKAKREAASAAAEAEATKQKGAAAAAAATKLEAEQAKEKTEKDLLARQETEASAETATGDEEREELADSVNDLSINGKDGLPSLQTPSFRGSAADVERMAREASSVPSTPMEGSAPRLPATPRTPSTPGLAGLPAKPISTMTPGASAAAAGASTASAAASLANATANGMKLDSDALERRRKATPSQLDITSAQQRSSSADAPLSSAASAALGSARFIDDISKVSYPSKILSPRAGLNETAEPGKFRYDRDFLMQFMDVYKERPQDFPSLSSIGMDSNQAAPARGGAPGRRPSGMGPPAAPGRSGSVGLGLGSGFGGKGGGMGQFSHPAKTSEERFAQSQGRNSVGAFGSSGPMGAFNAGARSQPLSRTGSGSASMPTREAMGTGMPSGGRTSSRRGKDRRDPGRSGMNPPEKGGPTIPLDEVVPLTLSENRWTGNRGQTVNSDSPELVTRKVKSLLNKLTMERFESISAQILEWANKSVDEKDGQTLRIVIALIFEKATDEAAWSEMYATLCRYIQEKLDPNIQDENIKTTDDKPVMGGGLFRKYLVNRCQEDFERGWAHRDATVAAAKSKEAEDLAKKAQNEKAKADAKEAVERGEKVEEEEKEAELLSDEYYEAQKAKRRGLGLVRFIGELFKFQMLTEKIMHLCVQKLLSNAKTPEEEEVESLCKLLTTVGKLLEEGKARSYVDVYFKRIDEMMSHADMTQRMKFMLQDVVELRQYGWRPRHDNSAPKTLAQIHQDMAKQKAQAELDRTSRHAGGPMSRGGSRRGQQREQYGADGFITVGNQPAPPVHQTKAGNLSAFGKGIDRSGTTRPLSVGPQSVFARKNQKSDDGSNPPSRTASSQNIFSLLSSTTEGGAGAGAASDPAHADDAAASSGRPKLNLTKRTKPLPGAEDDGEAKDDDDDEEDGGAAGADGKEDEEMSDEEAKRKIDNDIKELLAIKNVDEGKQAMESLPAGRRGEFVNKVVETALNGKEDFVKVVAQLFRAVRESDLLDDQMVETGVKDHVEMLDDIAIDVPNAYKYLATLLVASGLSTDKIDALAATIQGEGVVSPKDRLMAKVSEQQQQQ